MPSILRDLYYVTLLNLASVLSSQQLARLPEPDQVTTNTDAVNDYDQAHKSSLMLLYALNLKILQTFLPDPGSAVVPRRSLMDLACGPGIFGELACRVLHMGHYTGVDLSGPMIGKAKERFQKSGIEVETTFLVRDIKSLNDVPDLSQDSITIMDCAHHLESISDIGKVFSEAEKKVKTQGIILISDLVRPKNKFIARLYYRWLSKKNDEFHLKAHNLDFKNSIYAAFTVNELLGAIPKDTNRSWYLLTPFGFQYTQIILSLERNRKVEFYGLSDLSASYLPPHLKQMWYMTAITFKWLASVRQIR